jgi:hypothetical protein
LFSNPLENNLLGEMILVLKPLENSPKGSPSSREEKSWFSTPGKKQNPVLHPVENRKPAWFSGPWEKQKDLQILGKEILKKGSWCSTA